MSWDNEDENCEFDVEHTKAVTEKAILVIIGDIEVWLPLSQVIETDCKKVGDSGTVIISSWISKQKGLLP